MYRYLGISYPCFSLSLSSFGLSLFRSARAHDDGGYDNLVQLQAIMAATIICLACKIVHVLDPVCTSTVFSFSLTLVYLSPPPPPSTSPSHSTHAHAHG